MQKRTIIFGSYNTAEYGWTLGKWTLTDPEQKTNYVDKLGGDGSWDLSTALTNGLPRYSNRILTVPLECSKGTREDREELINEMVNTLDGLEWQIVLPDRPDHYLVGRLHIAVNYSDLAHAMVTVTGNVEPWLYFKKENITEIAELPRVAYLHNRGRRAAVPVLTVEGYVSLRYGDATTEITDGSVSWPALLLTPGTHVLECDGDGRLVVTYREAVLR